jgi:hypothetical protein
MERIALILSLAIFLATTVLQASENFQAPVPSGGKLLSSEDPGTINLFYQDKSMKEIIKFYKDRFEGNESIDWKEPDASRRVVIHDWGSREWHRIEVMRRDANSGVQITIDRDSWTWIIGTLVIRFVGVFTVLVILMIALYISGRIMTISVTKKNDEPNNEKI